MKRFGPGFLVAAAFIGPGTVTTASVAGAAWGYALAWTLLFAVISAMVLQEMSARLGLVTRAGLGEAIRQHFERTASRRLAAALVVVAIGVGNAAYQSGNLLGAGLGLTGLAGGRPSAWAVLCGLLAGLLLVTGAYRSVERILVVLVGLMAVTFLAAATLARPDLDALAEGLLTPAFPSDSGLMAAALIGTTVVPYNLFLHARAVCEKWPADRGVAGALSEARQDIAWSMGIGGLVTLAVMISAVPLYLAGIRVRGVEDMAGQLEPLLGPAARYCFAAGLFAAGISSAATAPLAAAWAVAGVLGWNTDMRSWPFQAVWLAVLAAGIGFASVGMQPVQAIILAQAANGLLLPLIVVFLLLVVNRKATLGAFRNRLWSNIAGGAVVLLTLLLGLYQLAGVIGLRG